MKFASIRHSHAAGPLILVLGIMLLSLPRTSLPQAPGRQSILLSVQNFEALSVSEDLARTVSELVRGELSRSSRLTILEETGRLYRIQKQSARFRELFAEGSLRRLGELLESRFTVTGSVSGLDGLFVLSARIVDAESGEILASETVEHREGVSTLNTAARTLARRLLNYFPLTGRITDSKADSLVADIGLADGVLPGQEFIVADLVDDERTTVAPEPYKSARYRVARAADSRSMLVAVMPGRAGGLGPGATVFSPGGMEELLEQRHERTGGLAALGDGNFGSLEVSSDPEGAVAIVAGLDVGRTPVTVSQLAAGRHQLILSLEGYEDVFDSVTVRPGTTGSFNYELERETGRLTIITSQPDVRLSIDTLDIELKGTARITLEDFPAGSHRIEARKSGYKTWRETLEIYFRQDSTLEITLEPHPGSVLVTSTPSGAQIFLDGLRTGRQTPWRLTRLEAGAHVVRLSLPGYGSAVDTVEIRPGEDLTAEITVREGWFGYEPVGMVPVPETGLVLGNGDTLQVGSFYIDIHEVTNRAYALFVEATGHRPPPHWPDGRPPEGMGDHPVCNVSFEDAASFATWSGKRLPTEDEWEVAAMGGGEQREFPWGNSYRAGYANIWSEGLNRTAPVGSYPEDRSRFGLYDVVGNVAEWVDSWFDRTANYRTYRGGSFYVNQREPGLLFRDGLYPVTRNKYIGFRCARDK